MSDEQELVRRMLAGDERAFTTFFESQFARVYRFALPRLNGDVEATREVVQATLGKAMRHLGQFRGEASLFTWIAQICRRQISDHIRSNQRYRSRVTLMDDHPEMRAALESIAAPEEYDLVGQYGREQTTRVIRAVLDRLPSRYADALEWKYIEGISVEMIGERLGIGPIAAQSLMQRARVALREALETVFGAGLSDLASRLES